MSRPDSFSTDSLSSTATMSTIQPDGPQIDPSNILYNDREHYHIIFTNDSRFFDTSLHLFKSYCKSGYIKFDSKKSKKSFFSLSPKPQKPITNGKITRLVPERVGFSSNNNIHRNTGEISKSSSFRNDDYSMNRRSYASSQFQISTSTGENLSLNGSHDRQSLPISHAGTNDDSSDDSDIIVTRL